ncbi:MAG: penicillin-binding protein 2 [Candidatus Moranbacteria bacterium]|nr:penicillin-binding protein 2 [Candidatus Moranbacteria bacterium]
MVKNANKSDGGENVFRWRINLLSLLIIFLGGVVFFRLYSLQIQAHDSYKEKARDQYMVSRNLEPRRGEIFLAEQENLFPAAVNKNMPTAFAIPKIIQDGEKREVARLVADKLELDLEEVEKKISKKDDLYEPLKKRLSEEDIKKVKDIGHEGIKLREESWRYYPGGSLAAQSVGFVGYNDHKREGIYGLEKYYQKKLEGSPGYLHQERDAANRWMSVGERLFKPAQDGNDLILGLDHIVQHKAEEALENAMKKHDADSGKIAIMDPYSGEILAMAQYPVFDLNNYSEVEDISVFKNALVSDAYECGSVFKAITMAAALDDGAIEYDETYVDTGQVEEGGYVIKNSQEKVHGKQTMKEVIEKSINTGMIYVEKKLGNKKFYDYIKKFGFGEKTGIDLPSEAKGDLSNLDTNRDIEYFTASFGQGITVTPIQLVSAYAAIANGGELFQPRLVDYILASSGKKEELRNEVRSKVISQDAANKISLMLESNVDNGHGKPAAVPGYRVAGKTGTAQIADKEKGGYLEDATVGSFAGFAPVDNPKFAMLVVVENPKDVEWAENTAAPIFGELSKFLFDYYGIEPSRDFTQEELDKFDKTHNYLRGPSEEEKEEEGEDNSEED